MVQFRKLANIQNLTICEGINFQFGQLSYILSV